MDENKRIFAKKKDNKKTEHISLRTTSEVIKIIEKNSIISGKSKSNFVEECIKKTNIIIYPYASEILNTLQQVQTDVAELSRKSGNNGDTKELSSSVSQLVLLLNENIRNLKKDLSS